MAHITPGRNGWTENAGKMARAINAKAKAAQAAIYEAELQERREIAEMEYYEENHCYPRATGYCGTETDAHFYER
ncbi:MAG: hypothetical protein ACOX4Q_06635 [Syntrophomonadales bacterium]